MIRIMQIMLYTYIESFVRINVNDNDNDNDNDNENYNENDNDVCLVVINSIF